MISHPFTRKELAAINLAHEKAVEFYTKGRELLVQAKLENNIHKVEAALPNYAKARELHAQLRAVAKQIKLKKCPDAMDTIKLIPALKWATTHTRFNNKSTKAPVLFNVKFLLDRLSHLPQFNYKKEPIVTPSPYFIKQLTEIMISTDSKPPILPDEKDPRIELLPSNI